MLSVSLAKNCVTIQLSMAQFPISSNLFFLYGYSGSGKSSLSRELQTVFKDRGYQVLSLSSGDLFRSAMADPVIAEQMKAGQFIESLDVIQPKIKAAFAKFLRLFEEGDGRTVMILDGLIRRSGFANAEGTWIPSQVDQVATALRWAATEQELEISQGAARHIIEYSRHVLIDLTPRDAERQLKARTSRALEVIYSQLRQLETSHGLGRQWRATFDHIQYSFVNNVDFGAEEKTAAAELQRLIDEYQIETELRLENLDPVGRRRLLANFLGLDAEGEVIPGPGAEALIKDLGFQLSPWGELTSARENAVKIPNGESRGYTYEVFLDQCRREGALLAQEANETLLALGGLEAELGGGLKVERR